MRVALALDDLKAAGALPSSAVTLTEAGCPWSIRYFSCLPYHACTTCTLRMTRSNGMRDTAQAVRDRH